MYFLPMLVVVPEGFLFVLDDPSPGVPITPIFGTEEANEVIDDTLWTRNTSGDAVVIGAHFFSFGGWAGRLPLAL